MFSRTSSALLFLQRKKREKTKSLAFICSRNKEQVPNAEKVKVLKSDDGRWVGRRGNDPTLLIFCLSFVASHHTESLCSALGTGPVEGEFCTHSCGVDGGEQIETDNGEKESPM